METPAQSIPFDVKDDDVAILEGQLTDSNVSPDVAVTATAEATPAPALPAPGATKLVSSTVLLAAGGAPFLLRAPDATRGEMHLMVTSGTATDEVRVASGMGDASFDQTSYLVPTDIEVVLHKFTGAVWVALATGSTGPAKLSMTSVVE